jgi:DNA-binding XRE family transcriptional regulator
MTPEPFDFGRVEQLRKYMLLSMEDMSVLLGVSRMTYYHWTRGRPLRQRNLDTVRVVVRKLLNAASQRKWPTPEAKAADPKGRREILVDLLKD